MFAVLVPDALRGGRAHVPTGVNPATEDGQKFGKKSSVHITAHLVEDEPVSERASAKDKVVIKKPDQASCGKSFF